MKFAVGGGGDCLLYYAILGPVILEPFGCHGRGRGARTQTWSRSMACRPAIAMDTFCDAACFRVGCLVCGQCFTICSAHDPERRITFASDGFLKLTGYTNEQVIGKPALFLVVSQTRWPAGLLLG